MKCVQCGAENDPGAKFCTSCGAKLGPPATRYESKAPRKRAPQSTSPLQPGEKEYALNKTPIVALLLSFLIPGVGQFYNGDMKKGGLILLGAIILGVITAGIGSLVLWVYGMYDAYQVADGKIPLWKS